jgi:hypothetical protein
LCWVGSRVQVQRRLDIDAQIYINLYIERERERDLVKKDLERVMEMGLGREMKQLHGMERKALLEKRLDWKDFRE